MEDEERKTKRIIFPLLDDVNPIKLRSSLTQMFKERFFRLFASTIDIEGVNSEERLEIIKRIWNDGSFNISRSPSPVESFNEDMDLVFTKYEIDKFNFYMNPYKIRNVPLKDSKAISKKQLTVGKDAVIVYWSDFCRAKRTLIGVRSVANRYIKLIVNAMMTINTNLLMHKMPFIVACDEDEVPIYKETMQKIFSDYPFVFIPTSINRQPATIQTNTPYIIDKLTPYIQFLENRFLDEIGIDNSKPLQTNQDRMLVDEVNSNNSLIQSFKNSIIDTMNEGFEEAEEIFGKRIRAKSKIAAVLSIHEEKKEPEPEPQEE